MTQDSCEHCLLGCIIVKRYKEYLCYWALLGDVGDHRLWEPVEVTVRYTQLFHHSRPPSTVELLLSYSLAFWLSSSLLVGYLTPCSWYHDCLMSLLLFYARGLNFLYWFVSHGGWSSKSKKWVERSWEKSKKCWVNLSKQN